MTDLRSFADFTEKQLLEQRPLPQDNLILPPGAAHRVETIRYVMLTGVDRDMSSSSSKNKRFSFSVEVAGFKASSLHSAFRNVTSMAVSKVIIPMALSTAWTSSSSSSSSCFSSFGHPYIIMNIENINLYEGMNDALRGAFAVLRYDSSYMGPNGRGYVVLVPMQNEVKTWPSPLASLNHLHISLTKPNNTLVSNSGDDFRLSRIEYDASFVSSLWMKLVMSEYFDRQEFTVGDNVYLRNCIVKTTASVYPGAAATTAQRELEEFLNRSEGHDVVHMGQANDKGFFKTFYILAPGSLDQALGRVVVEAHLIDLIQSVSSDSSGQSSITGDVINATLQVSVALRITTCNV
jgi:hypothetical protein